LKKSIKAKIEDLLSSSGFVAEMDPAQKYLSDRPLRSELFSSDQMKEHAKRLAGWHQVKTSPGPDLLLSKLSDNEDILLRAYDLATKASEEKRRTAPASEWLLDNFYLVEEQIRTSKQHLPKEYSKELPSLTKGPLAGYPRIYDIAQELTYHLDARLDEEAIYNFIDAYQTVTPLTLGELWAIPIMLRLALIENLRRIASRIISDRMDFNQAADWADLMTKTSREDPKNLILIMADLARSDPNLSSAFVAELSRKLQRRSPQLVLVLKWIDQRLSDEGTSVERMVELESQKQAADRVSFSNSIYSLKFLESIDWKKFVESLSLVEQILHGDPHNSYCLTDFSTRDNCRHVVERVAKYGLLTEVEVAQKVVELASKGVKDEINGHDRSSYVEYYLLDKGLKDLEKIAQVNLPSTERILRLYLKFPLFFYLGFASSLTVLITVALLMQAQTYGLEDAILLFVGFLLLLCVSHTTVALTNWITTLLIKPHMLSRMDFSEGIPPDFRTLIAVPTVVSSSQDLHELLQNLEVRYLGNPDPNLYFSLLIDLPDAAFETVPKDLKLLKRVQEGVQGLNEKYWSDRFLLFTRTRQYNPREGVWMGNERKRGILSELNSLLQGGLADNLSLVVGDPSILKSFKYVIVLDTDTKLPRDSAWQMVGILAHPLNRPRFDATKQRITEGYGIVQPRVETNLVGKNRSIFLRIVAGKPGIDPYSKAVSNVYQDLFHEGSFIGKGIYDVDAFTKAVGNRFPDNLILSHDLLEGCYVRSALASDVQLYEEHPSSYLLDARRRHRWVRGDWQIATWLLPWVPGRDGWHKNTLSALSKWKILDNLRRSLLPLAQVLLLIFGWTLLWPSWFWTGIVIATVLSTPFLTFIVDFFRKPPDLPMGLHLRFVWRSVDQHLAPSVFSLAFLPYEALQNLDAISRSLVRMLVSHKHRLEWTTSQAALFEDRANLRRFFRAMWAAPLVALITVLYMSIWRQIDLIVTIQLQILWFFSPVLGWRISRHLPRPKPKLSDDQICFLRRLSRRTWSFFETFVGPEDYWLPPDNYQEYPLEMLAHRTSPTNMGISLLANQTAYDFGYISAGQLIERTSDAINSMQKLDRYKGHFYNWYDTQSLQPLQPLYISAVDSGNLTAHLLTLREGLLELPHLDILPSQFVEGLIDTHGVLVETIEKSSASSAQNVAYSELMARLEDMRIKLQGTSNDLFTVRHLLEELGESASEVSSTLKSWRDVQINWWARAVEWQIQDSLNDLDQLAPWTVLPLFDGDMWNFKSYKQMEPLLEQFSILREIPSLEGVVNLPSELQPLIDQMLEDFHLDRNAPEDAKCLRSLRRVLVAAGNNAFERIRTIEHLGQQLVDLSNAEYDFLFDRSHNLLAIGYNVSEHSLNAGRYDLLASEARLASFVAIAEGQLPQKHWFSLGRLVTTARGKPVLISWGGSMFEYLMPLLVMPTFENTLLEQTYHTVVERQIEYGKQNNVPWGISESGYNATDVHLNYQYRAFGVPGLGFKRGLAEDDLVIAPYASMMALMVYPKEACINLQRMKNMGYLGRYGFYEAVDFTPSRLSGGRSDQVVHSFMAHHEGMGFLSLAYLLLDQPMQRRFLSNPQFQSAELLLQELVPNVPPFYPHATEVSVARRIVWEQMPTMRIFDPHTPQPEVQILSNGNYQVMVTNSGGGYSRWQNLAVTRWREDPTLDNQGTFCYIRDLTSGEVFSTGYQPTLKKADSYQAIFHNAVAEFRRSDKDVETHTIVVVSPEDDIEIRHITVINRSWPRIIEFTSYGEVVLDSQAADERHPAVDKLFVETEIVQSHQAILCHRRPRSKDEDSPWVLHLMTVQGVEVDEISYETDRYKFIGRGRNLTNPQALDDTSKLSGSQGAVLDPIVSIRRLVRVDPGKSVTLNLITGVAKSREEAMKLVEKYHEHQIPDMVTELARTRHQVLLCQLNTTESEAQLYMHLASSIIYVNPSMRSSPSILMKNHRGQSGLWGYGISGDLPIVLLRIGDRSGINLVRQVVCAQSYWRKMNLKTDLIILNEDHSGYRQLLHDDIMSMITTCVETEIIDRPGGIFVRREEQISEDDKILMQTVARLILTDSWGTLEEQIDRLGKMVPNVPMFSPIPGTEQLEYKSVPIMPPDDLRFFNGLGGFSPDGREYVIVTTHEKTTPTPWSNVLANPKFGTLISESGGCYTWGENAHEFRISPWFNDPVSDPSGEAFYLRDEESGLFWSPTMLPTPGKTAHIARHGFGYSVFEHSENGIRSELLVYVAMDASIKFSILKVVNESGRTRRLSATNYVELVLGELRPQAQMYVITEIDPSTGALFARNPYNTNFADNVVFLDVNSPTYSWTCDREEFLGRNGTTANPAAMKRVRLSGKVGAAQDPCATIQIQFELAEGQEQEIIFTLGAGSNLAEARDLVRRFRGSGPAKAVLERVKEHWDETLGVVQIETPDRSLDLLTNGWLIYQVIACRIWARSGYYQSGGAFGFRDQLQDVMALVHIRPQLVREHLLRCAAHQFLEGDVQHWWHPPTDFGVRTNISDDYLWLPYVACHYVFCTGDWDVLKEEIEFLEGRQIEPQEEAFCSIPSRSGEKATLYQHCTRALERGLKFGGHGLPLMGSGDWNDGMNLVGHEGKGESIWLGFFLYQVLVSFSRLAEGYGDVPFSKRCLEEADRLRQNLEKHAWDGQWYLRAYFDDGKPLGSISNPECQIDSIPQSWAVLSGAGDPKRLRQAMEAIYEQLVHRDGALIMLFAPPFDKWDVDPGYIKGYLPGVRENGGQYTHAAVWSVMAFASLGQNDRAWELLSFLNPINHGATSADVATYEVEPYVMSADVYATKPHVGRGGWTWYTGSASWMYRLIVETILGLKLEDGRLSIQPHVPSSWSSFKLHYRYGDSLYHITVRIRADGRGVKRVFLDGKEQKDESILLIDDHMKHMVEVNVG